MAAWEAATTPAVALQAVRTMWEVPTIGHLLYLLQEPLRLGTFCFTEFELGLLQPRSSQLVARAMVGLLSPLQVLAKIGHGDQVCSGCCRVS